MHLCSTLLTCSPAPSTHESGLVNVEVLKKNLQAERAKNFHGLTNPKMLPPALPIEYVASYQRLINTLLWGLPSWEFAGRTPEQWKLAEGGPPLLVYIIRIYIYYIYTQCMYRLYNEDEGLSIIHDRGAKPEDVYIR